MVSVFALLVLLLFNCSQVLRVSAFNLIISPDHVRVPRTTSSDVTIMCNANVSLSGCQFTWIAKDGKVSPILELHRGQHSQPHLAHLNSRMTDYRYSGRGLAKGDCGVTFQIMQVNIWMVGCRVQSSGGSWKYAWMDLFSDGWTNPPNTVMPREAIVVPGGQANITVKSTDPLTECRFSLPGATLVFDQGAGSPASTGRHTYLGTGLQNGDCSLTLANVSEADNGPATCKIRRITPDKDDYRFIPLVVASPPSAPFLDVTQKGADVTATCAVGPSRPIANITWFFGDKVIRQDSVDDSPGDAKDEWRWPWIRGSISQKVSLQLQPKDNGKVLECVVSHVALAQPLEAYHKMVFTATSSAEVQAQEAAEIAMETAKANLEATRCSVRVEEARAREVEAKAKASELAVEAENATATAAKEVAEIAVETAKVNLEAARSSAKTEEAQAKAAELAVDAANSTARAAKESAEIAMETAKAKLQAAKSSARTEEAKAKAAELAVDTANSTARAAKEAAEVAMDAARYIARAEEARAKNEEARTREEETWATNTEEELQFERERRSQS